MEGRWTIAIWPTLGQVWGMSGIVKSQERFVIWWEIGNGTWNMDFAKEK